jgi:hypothetical protein
MASAGMREFKIGQYVYYRPRNRVRAEGRYVVMRLLPQAHPIPRVHGRGKRTAQGPWPDERWLKESNQSAKLDRPVALEHVRKAAGIRLRRQPWHLPLSL